MRRRKRRAAIEDETFGDTPAHGAMAVGIETRNVSYEDLMRGRSGQNRRGARRPGASPAGQNPAGFVQSGSDDSG